MTFYGSWANEILTGYFHVVLVRIIFNKETEHVNDFGKEDEAAMGDFGKEDEIAMGDFGKEDEIAMGDFGKEEEYVT